MRPPLAVLFDLDGTLVDSVPDLARCVNAALHAVGHAPADEAAVRGWVGNGAARLLHRALTGQSDGVAPADQHAAAMQVFNAAYSDEPCRHSRLYPGVTGGLARLRTLGLRLAVVTNKPERFIAPLLTALGVAEHFDAWVGGDTTARLKPDPLPVLRALTRVDCSSADALLVGDSRIDMAAGAAAGVATVAVSYGYDAECDFRALGAVAVVDEIGDLVALWAEPGAVHTRRIS